jgi:porphyrinogen peroxidase
MTRPLQTQNVLVPPARAAIFLVVTVRSGAEGDVRDALTNISGLTRAVGFRAPEDGLSCVVGIGSGVWDRLYGPPRPKDLHPFRRLEGARHIAVSTPGDLLFHLRARRMDLCFELARQIMGSLLGHVDVVDEVYGFRYFDERDLMGFVDGTENPEGVAAAAAVLIGDEDPTFRDGSYVIVQKYLHNLDAWDALSVEEQELVMGRRKLSDIELPDSVKPPNSHVALNTIYDADGRQRQIVRDNMPFGSVAAGEFGTYFIGYAATPDVIEQMLHNMFIGKPPGNTDRILDFSTAHTGGLFFVPTEDFLDDPSTTHAASTTAGPPSPTDGSMAIGSLKRSPTS